MIPTLNVLLDALTGRNPTKSIQNQTKSITQKQINNTGICKILFRFCSISRRRRSPRKKL